MSEPNPCFTVQSVIRAIGKGDRLVIPENGDNPYLMDGFAAPDAIDGYRRPVSREIAEKTVAEAPLVELTPDGEFDERGRMIRGGYKKFYQGPPAKIYCLVQ